MLTQGRVKQLLDYDENTGRLTWREHRGSKKAGSTAGFAQGFNRSVYWRVRIDGVSYSAARIIWLMVCGCWPDQIDHINRDSLDNRFENLRSVSPSDNSKNRGKRSDNPHGITGIYWQKHRQRWTASIQSDGRVENLYAGRDFLEACCRRKSAELRLGFNENHGK